MADSWFPSTSEQDLVSVIIPCRNGERFLPATLESLARQEYRPIEAILIDDGSSDGSRAVMEEFGSRQAGGMTVKCLFQTKLGVHHARNEGTMNSRGEFIQFLDADDLLSPEKIREQVGVLKVHREADVVYGEAQYLICIGPNEKRLGRVIGLGACADIIASFLSGEWLPPFSYLSRRSAVQRCGPWDDAITYAEDFEYFIRMAITGSLFAHKAGLNGYYRKHSLETVSERDPLEHNRAYRMILLRAEENLRKKGELSEKRALGLAESHRRVARSVYASDYNCFQASIDDVLRLIPGYLPAKRKARIASLLMGFRNYERLAASVSRFKHRPGTDWT